MTELLQIRWHGRGGQGAVTSAELVALAAIEEGKFAQAFPSFGPERRGAPVLAFNRISPDQPIRIRTTVEHPDIVVVLDTTLLSITDVTSGLKEDGTVIVNTPKTPVDIKSALGGQWRTAVVNATAIARETLGVPIVNTTMLGALVKATKIVELDSLTQPMKERFGLRAKANIDACHRAYQETLVVERETITTKRRKASQEERLLSWREMPVGCVVAEPGSASQYQTGDWKSQHPVWDYEKCNNCGLCYLYCPEFCINQNRDGYFEANFYYCKGCGICSQECPKQAITMVEES